MKWKVINASVRGSSHQRTGMPNQDAVDYATSGKGDAPITVLAVSDGHGGGRHFRSQVGSTLAAHVAVQVVQEVLARESLGRNGDAGGGLVGLTQEIVGAWTSAVAQDLAHNPFTEVELDVLAAAEGDRSRDSVVERPELAYGATLLVAAATENRIIYLQLGDGDILTVAADGTTTRPMPEDARLVGNQTTSLCQLEAWREFRTAETAASQGLPALILLSSDGYVNSFRSQEDFLQIGQDYLQILREQGSEVLSDELPNILTEATQQGSGDDITLGILHAAVLPSVATAAKIPSVRSKPHISQSVIIRELTKQQSAQEQKLSELETGYAGARRHVLQLRLLIGAVVLMAIGALTQQYWWPAFSGRPVKAPTTTVKRQGKGGPVAGEPQPSAGDPASGPLGAPLTPEVKAPPVDKPTAGTASDATDCVLVLDGGRELVVTAGKTINTSDLTPGTAKHPYAKVKKQDNLLYLSNLSGDAWIVTSPGSDKPTKYAGGDIVPLRQDMKIIFNKSIAASVTFRSKSS
jgi:hypothetical protein